MFLTRAKRWRVQYPVQVACQDYIDEAKTLNVSLHGLSIETTQPMPVGSHLYVRLLLPNRTSSVDYEICTVQWAAGGAIGLESCEMRTAAERRLHRHLTSLNILERAEGQRALSIPVAQPLGRTSETPGFLQQLMKPLLATTRCARRFAVATRKHLAR